MHRRWIALPALLLPVVAVITAPAGADSDAEALSRRLQNPLANIKALMTETVIGLDSGDTGDTSFGFQLQPVYAIDLPDRGVTLLPRAIIPIVGLEPGTDVPNVGEDGNPSPSRGNDRVWGLGDSALQLFVAPHTDSAWKWGVGPQLSLPTHTDSRLRGPDFGAGVAGVLVGQLPGGINFAGLVGQHFAFDGDFAVATIQPMFFYNIPGLPGTSINYTGATAIDWQADSGDKVTLPLGFGLSQSLVLGGGHGVNFSVGPYYNIVRPDGAPDWTLRFGFTWVAP